ncbi:homogentisate 1,2-dioxygenase [Facilibium subflavum]|uniref:homogentisate 1,2-dioxygenase n=1 Tax=Facilibium subflavum TaxID=2219058 RepID=UPI000E646DAF|nr:homogentisate 1,2-dioxygenase [Facilibium subflavum]
MDITYQAGFHNYFETEAVDGALPKDRNSPQMAPLGLYVEQVNNSAFTAPKSQNFKVWQYRIRPSVLHCGQAVRIENHLIRDKHHTDKVYTPPIQMRWHPRVIPDAPTDVISSLTTMAYNDVAAIHLYAANQSMTNSYFYNADGQWLFVLEQGGLRFKTESGVIDAKPGEIVVIPRGIRYQVILLDETARGYICEVQSSDFYLPERGPIGANGLAEERHFLAPSAYFEDKSGQFTLYTKFQGQLWQMPINYSPLDVVAWHGNLYPYKYDLRLFTPVNAVLKDHSDPSIFTVLSAPSTRPSVADLDFVIFPPRWVVAEDTFRPPYYHRNVMSEFMGLIFGQYDAKHEGFSPGGASLHNTMSAHGPDQESFEKASISELKPDRYKGNMAFMFESNSSWQVTDFALNSVLRQKEYLNCWQGLKANFNTEILNS